MSVAKTKLSLDDYVEFRDFIYKRLGLYFPDSKRRDLERCINHRLAKSGHSSLGDYLSFVSQISRDHEEMKHLVSDLTIGETYFFRDEGQMEVIKKNILQPLITKRNISNNRLKIWSAGCASGEEPYSLAMIVRELIPYTSYWKIEIMATDINHQLLKKAKTAKYNNWSFRNTAEEVKKRFFSTVNNDYRLADEIKEMVTFDYLNLAEFCYPSPINRTTDIDLIVCRNVAIYFDKETTGQIVNRFYDCLSDDGWLVMGASDPYISTSKFKNKEFAGVFVYHKEKKAAKTIKAHSFDKKIKSKMEIEADKLSVSLPLMFAKSPDIKEAPGSLRNTANFYAAGMHLYHSGKIEQAIAKFHHGIEENDYPAKCAHMIAKMEANKGNLEEAKKWCKKAIAIDKLLLEGHFLLSMIYQGLEKDHMAIESLKKAIYIDRNFAEGYFCLGTIYKKQGKKELAKRAFGNAESLLSNKPAGKEIPECEGMTFGKLLKCVKANI